MLVTRLAPETLEEGAQKLGLLDGHKIVLRSESEAAVLMDYCIFNVVRQGKNAVERYLDEAPLASDEIELDYWQAMRSATYAWIVVESVVPSVGCHIKNLFNNTRRFLVDIGYSASVTTGAVLATRLLDYGDFVTTGGAGLPIGLQSTLEDQELLAKVTADFCSDAFDPAAIIQTALELGASSRIRFDEPSNNTLRVHREQSQRPREVVLAERRQLSQKLARRYSSNRRCQCGSGKMFKNCCGK
jgi:hypothetical protein